MTKYYRVRTQEQWEWLCNKLNLSQAVIERSIAFPTVLRIKNDDGLRIEIIYYGAPKNVSEISDLMEDEKMEDYVEIKGRDIFKIKDEENLEAFCYSSDTNESNNSFDLISYINELHIPKSLLYPKVPMTEAEKKEFDRVGELYSSLYPAMAEIFDNPEAYPKLNEKMFYAEQQKEINEIQFEFARAWSDESLIEVIPDRKWKVKVPRSDESYYFKDKIDGKAYLTTVSVEPKNTNGALFTDEELKQFGLDDNFFEKVEVKDD